MRKSSTEYSFKNLMLISSFGIANCLRPLDELKKDPEFRDLKNDVWGNHFLDFDVLLIKKEKKTLSLSDYKLERAKNAGLDMLKTLALKIVGPDISKEAKKHIESGKIPGELVEVLIDALRSVDENQMTHHFLKFGGDILIDAKKMTSLFIDHGEDIHKDEFKKALEKLSKNLEPYKDKWLDLASLSKNSRKFVRG